MDASESTGPRRRLPAYTLVKILVAAALFCGLVVLMVGWLGFGRRVDQRLTARMGAQQATRKALVRFIQELQEAIEVLSPRPGSTLSYALVRDQVNGIRGYCPDLSRLHADADAGAGRRGSGAGRGSGGFPAGTFEATRTTISVAGPGRPEDGWPRVSRKRTFSPRRSATSASPSRVLPSSP